MRYCHHILCLVVLVVQNFSIQAANENMPEGARSCGMGNASVCLVDSWSAFNNQAGLAYLDESTLAVSYQNPYLIKEMGISSFSAIYSGSLGIFSISYTSLGNNVMREHNPGLSYSRKFGEDFSAGLQINYAIMEFPEEAKVQGVFLPEGGILYRLSSDWSLGVHIYNPFQQSYSLLWGEEKIPTIFKVGCAGVIQNDLLLSFELEKDLKYKPIYKVGIEYQIREIFFMRGGFNVQPGIFSLGMGYRKNRIRADVSFSRHGYLGYSPSLSIAFHLGK